MDGNGLERRELGAMYVMYGKDWRKLIKGFCGGWWKANGAFYIHQ